MGWEERRGRSYFYRAKRVNGRVVKEYVGTGSVGEIAAANEATQQQERAEHALKLAEARNNAAAIETCLDRLDELAETAAHEALVAAGFHLHRGQWRKRRDHHDRHDKNDGEGTN